MQKSSPRLFVENVICKVLKNDTGSRFTELASFIGKYAESQ